MRTTQKCAVFYNELSKNYLMEPVPFTSPVETYHAQSVSLLEAVSRRDREALKFMIGYNLRIQKLGEAAWDKKDFTQQDADEAILNWYHFKSQEELETYTRAVQEQPAVAQFEQAVEAIIAGDEQKLSALLKNNPALIKARSIRWHGATLLHYVGANGVEDFRQKTPPNAVAICKILLEAGADVNAEAAMYGGGSTCFGLAATSIWPAKAGVLVPLLETLLAAGASIGSDDGGAVVGCLANGRPEAAEALVRFGASLNLEGAAGTGRLDVVKTYFTEDGKLKDPALQDEMEKGFMWACEFGRTAVVEFLLDAGFPPDKQVEGMAGLHWAVIGAHPDTIDLLINRGASLENENKYGGTVLESTLWAVIHSDPVYRWPDEIADYPTIIERLLQSGAVIRNGVIPWLESTDEIPPEKKRPIEILLKKYSASSQ
jgi:ankyrin repeat protein